MTYTVADFGKYEAFVWEDERLTLHGYPPLGPNDTLQNRLMRLQLDLGFRGTHLGGGADGLQGPKSLAFLYSTPAPQPRGIDLTPWKVTLPTGEEGHPTEWFPIGTHEDAPWFVNHGSAGVTFRARTDGVTTENSDYPRSELREMNLDGSKADWSNRTGPHSMSVRLAVTHLPEIKPHVVCAQVHDATDDVMMVRLEDQRLFVESPYAADADLDTKYQLGTPFDLSVLATPDGMKVTYNNSRSVTLPGLLRAGCYFKAGCYTQASSRVSRSSSKYGTGYGEVDIYALEVSH